MYKVVAIIKTRGDSSRLEYAYVPSSWEENGILSWPNKNATSMRKNAKSKPEADWLKYKCKVKKSNLMQLDEAELWEEEFLSASSTEVEDGLAMNAATALCTVQLETPPKSAKNVQSKTEYDFLFNEVVQFEKSNEAELKKVAAELSTPNFDSNIHFEQQPEEAATFALNPEYFTSMSYKLNGIEKRLKRVEEKCDNRFAQMQIVLDKIYLMLKDCPSSICTTASSQHVLMEDFETKFEFPLDDLSSVKLFDEELRNNDFKKFMTQKLSVIGGTSGNEIGKEIAKKIVFATFTKQVLTVFSWTGISRTGGVEKKESFQSLECIVELFFQIIKLADTRWSKKNMETFFKNNILKHAKKMSENQIKKNEKTIETTEEIENN